MTSRPTRPLAFGVGASEDSQIHAVGVGQGGGDAQGQPDGPLEPHT